MASCSEDKTAKIWNVSTGQQVHNLVHNSSVTSVAFLRDGKMLATGAERDVRLWDPHTGNMVGKKSDNNWADFIAFSWMELHSLR